MNYYTLMLVPITCLILACIAVFMAFVNYNYRVSGFGKKLAIHECGHAMIIAGYRPIPHSTHISVTRTQNRYDGFVYCNFAGIDTSNKEYVELRMLMLLAGKMAEKSCLKLGQISVLSADDDLDKWQMLAAQKIDTNNKVKRFFLTKILQRKQEKALKLFFKDNVLVLQEMAELLLKENTLFFYDIEPFLEKIKYPKSFPVVTPR